MFRGRGLGGGLPGVSEVRHCWEIAGCTPCMARPADRPRRRRANPAPQRSSSPPTGPIPMPKLCWNRLQVERAFADRREFEMWNQATVPPATDDDQLSLDLPVSALELHLPLLFEVMAPVPDQVTILGASDAKAWQLDNWGTPGNPDGWVERIDDGRSLSYEFRTRQPASRVALCRIAPIPGPGSVVGLRGARVRLCWHVFGGERADSRRRRGRDSRGRRVHHAGVVRDGGLGLSDSVTGRQGLAGPLPPPRYEVVSEAHNKYTLWTF